MIGHLWSCGFFFAVQGILHKMASECLYKEICDIMSEREKNTAT